MNKDLDTFAFGIDPLGAGLPTDVAADWPAEATISRYKQRIRATLGRVRNRSEGFGWDNEYDEHTVDVPAFAIDRYPVSNAQYLACMAAGRYPEARERAYPWQEETPC